MNSSASVSLVIPAAGVGERLGGTHKISLRIAGRTLLEWVLQSLAPIASEVIVAHPAGEPAPHLPGMRTIAGGATRQHTVQLLAAEATGTYTIVHDVARPFVSRKVIQTLLTELAHADAVTTALPVADTIMHVSDYHIVHRGQLLRVQTPQAFRTTALVAAHAHAQANGHTATDDFQLVRHHGGTTSHVLGSEFTRKITTPEDIAIAEAIANSPAIKDFT